MTKISASAQSAIEQIASKFESDEIDVPMLPDVARRVLELVNDSESEVSQLAQIIQSDQSLAAHVLRIANSPAYCLGAPVITLQQAITRLGLNLMAEIALAASLNSRMFNAKFYQTRITSLWGDTLTVGLWAKEVARIGKQNVEAAFLCGLLHSIGRPVVLQTLASLNIELKEEDLLQVEEAWLIKVNAQVSKQWELPRIVAGAITEYRQPIDQINETALLVRAGIVMKNWMKGDREELPNNSPNKADIFARLNFYPDDLELLVSKYEIVVETQESMKP